MVTKLDSLHYIGDRPFMLGPDNSLRCKLPTTYLQDGPSGPGWYADVAPPVQSWVLDSTLKLYHELNSAMLAGARIPSNQRHLSTCSRLCGREFDHTLFVYILDTLVAKSEPDIASLNKPSSPQNLMKAERECFKNMGVKGLPPSILREHGQNVERSFTLPELLTSGLKSFPPNYTWQTVIDEWKRTARFGDEFFNEEVLAIWMGGLRHWYSQQTGKEFPFFKTAFLFSSNPRVNSIPTRPATGRGDLPVWVILSWTLALVCALRLSLVQDMIHTEIHMPGLLDKVSEIMSYCNWGATLDRYTHERI